MKERIVQLLKEENLSATKFADIIGVQRSSISHILSGRNKPSYDFIQKTLKKFPEINPEWLIMGIGNLYKNKDEFIKSTDSRSLNINEKNEKNLFSEIKEESIKNTTIRKVTNVNNGKIIRIIIFYEDRSFEEYKPK